VALLREGLSTAEVAERLGVPRPTVWRWQNELPELADVRRRESEPGIARAPRHAVMRVALTVIVIVLSVFFLYLGYC
jgi:transposase